MNLEIDSLNQRCDGLQIKAGGMGELSEFCEAEQKHEAAEKNLMVIKDNA